MQCWQLVGLRKTWSWKQWVIWGLGGLAGRDGDRLREGEWDEMEGLGLTDGEMDGERLFTRGEPGRSGGEGGGGSVVNSRGMRASLKDLWKKFSTLLLRMSVLKDRERFSFWSCINREREKTITIRQSRMGHHIWEKYQTSNTPSGRNKQYPNIYQATLLAWRQCETHKI